MWQNKGENIPVIFRKDKETGEVVAVFPTLFYYGKARWTEVWCYTHSTQHGEINYYYYQMGTKPATENEYKPLLKELEGRGYTNLKVYKKWLFRGEGYKNAATA